MSPWAPIAATVLVTVVAALLVWRWTHEAALANAAALFVLAAASAILGLIATVAFFWAALLLICGIVSVFTWFVGRRAPRT